MTLLEKSENRSFLLKALVACLFAAAASYVFANYLFAEKFGDDDIAYMYVFYISVGIAIYIASKFTGREIYPLVLLPRLMTAGNLMEPVFHMSADDSDFQNPLKLHAFTLVWLTIFLFEFLELLISGRLKTDRIILSGIAVLFFIAAVTLVARGGNGMAMYIENYLSPISFFLLMYLRRDSLTLPKMRRTMMVIMIVMVVFAIFGFAEYAEKDNIFGSWFVGGLRNQISEAHYRVIGTLGQTLYPTVMLFACFLARRNVAHLGWRYVLYALFAASAFFSQSRTLSALIFLYIFVAEAVPYLKKNQSPAAVLTVTIIAAVLAAIALIVMSTTEIGQQFMARIMNDAGSSNARMLQIEYFFDNIASLPLYGLGGFPNAVTIVDEHGSAIIAEIPWINLYFEVSPVVLAMLLLFLVFLVHAGTLRMEMIFLLVAFTPYTSFTAKTPAYYFVYVLAIYSIVVKQAGTSDEPADMPPPARVGQPVSNLPPPRRGAWVRPTAFICAVVIACAAGGGFINQRMDAMEKKYRASLALFVNPLPETDIDRMLFVEHMQYAAWINKYIADDAARLMRSGELIKRMKVRYAEKTGVELEDESLLYNLSAMSMNPYGSRVIQIEYTGPGAQSAADVVNSLAEVSVEYIRELFGFEFAYISAEAPVPVAPVAPRVIALTVIGTSFGAAWFSSILLLFMLPGRFRRVEEALQIAGRALPGAGKKEDAI